MVVSTIDHFDPPERAHLMHIAIIGAGIAGLSCARQLQSQGHAVTVYEKTDNIGGRAGTRQTELGGFDHGAQYFTATSKPFKQLVNNWKKAGLVAEWKGRLVELNNGSTKAIPAAKRAIQRWVAQPGMSALAEELAQGLDIRLEQPVVRIEPYGKQWLLAVRSETVPINASAGPFDAVVVAAPVGHAGILLEAFPQFAKKTDRIRTMPCWALMLGFQQPLEQSYDGAWVFGSRLSWIARDASKPQRRPGEHWVAHASGNWSIEHFEDDPERAKEKLLRAFHEATGSQIQPVYATIHRWVAAQVVQPLPDDCLWDAAANIGACGDWFAAGLDGNGRIENAYLSGSAIAEKIAATAEKRNLTKQAA